MLRLTVTIPGELTERVTAVLTDSPAVSTLAVLRGAALRPVGDQSQNARKFQNRERVRIHRALYPEMTKPELARICREFGFSEPGE